MQHEVYDLSPGAATAYKSDRFNACFSRRSELYKMGRLKNGKLARILKKLTLGYLKVLSHGETEGNHDNPQSG